MSLDVIYVVNQSARVSAAELTAMVSAVNTQITRDFAVAWNLGPTLVEVAASADDVPQKPNYETIVLRDDAGDPGALGWHTETAGAQIFGVIGVNPVLDSGGVVLLDPGNAWRLSVASVLSHEVLETIADQFVNAWCDGPRIPQGSEYALEVCDPVEADQYVVELASGEAVAVSSFVWPSWFDPEATGQVCQMGTAPGPFQLAPGGYMVVRTGGGESQQVMGAQGPAGRPMRPWRIGMAKAAGFRSAKRRRSLRAVA